MLYRVFDTVLVCLFQFVTFCEKLARVMKLHEIADDVGLDVNGDALIARGEQLVKLEVRHFTLRERNIYKFRYSTAVKKKGFLWPL